MLKPASGPLTTKRQSEEIAFIRSVDETTMRKRSYMICVAVGLEVLPTGAGWGRRFLSSGRFTAAFSWLLHKEQHKVLLMGSTQNLGQLRD